MNQPPNEPSRPSIPEDSSDGFPVLEGYDIIDQLGRGGMGIVYEAFQRSTSRRVAVKLMLERVAATEAARRRFEREVELIARLQHPNIVGILDSGLHKGRYFYVMDFVEGSGFDHRFRPGNSDIREVLRVVAKVARAVDYAHQRGVMHRDLKPANILIDQRGEPHLLDFGLAKAFDPNSLVAMRDSLSEPGQVIGTLGYMAPEQARGSMGEVSVRSDVYALGAIAYEMVAGSLPCPIDGPMAIVFQRIESRDPDRPSTVRPGGGVPADVDAVLMKALEKDPSKRYATAGAFADDVERWLGNRPVAARHVGPLERGVRWCRRNPALAGLAIAMGLALAILAGSAWWTSRASRQREQAEKIKSDIDATLGDAMLQLDPDKNPGLFEAAALTIDRIEAGLATTPRPPLEEAVWRERIAEQQRKIGEFEKAERNARRVVELRRGLASGDDADLARALRNLGAALFDLSRFTDALEPYRASLEMRQRLAGGRDNAAVADSLNHLAQCLTRLGNLEEAEPLQRASFEMRRRLFGEGDEHTIAAQNNIATILMNKGDFARGEAIYREAMQRFVALNGEKHRYVGRSLRNIAACVVAQGRLDEADELLKRALAVTTDVIGPTTPETAGVLHDIAALRLAQGHPAEAEPLARQSLEIRLNKLGPSNQDSVDSRLVLGNILLASGRVTEAEPMLREALDRRLQANPPVATDVAEARLALGVTLVALDRSDEGMPLIRDGVRAIAEHRPAGDPRSRTLFAALEGNLGRLPQNDEIREARAVLVPGSAR